MGDLDLGKVIGTRYPLDVEQALQQLENPQGFIREVVECFEGAWIDGRWRYGGIAIRETLAKLSVRVASRREGLTTGIAESIPNIS